MILNCDAELMIPVREMKRNLHSRALYYLSLLRSVPWQDGTVTKMSDTMTPVARWHGVCLWGVLFQPGVTKLLSNLYTISRVSPHCSAESCGCCQTAANKMAVSTWPQHEERSKKKRTESLSGLTKWQTWSARNRNQNVWTQAMATPNVLLNYTSILLSG